MRVKSENRQQFKQQDQDGQEATKAREASKMGEQKVVAPGGEAAETETPNRGAVRLPGNRTGGTVPANSNLKSCRLF